MRKLAMLTAILLGTLASGAVTSVLAQSQSADQTAAARQATQRAQLAKAAQQLATQLQAQAAKSKQAAADRAKAAEAAKAAQAADAAKAAEAAKIAAAKAAADAKAAETARADAASKAAAAAQADASASAAQSAMAAAERAARQELALRAKYCSLKCVAINQMSGLQDLTDDLPRGDIYTITETMLDIRDRQKANQTANQTAAGGPIALAERPKSAAVELKGGGSVSIHFTYPADATPTINGTRRIFGIDISHYNSATLFQADLRANAIAYVYAKATQGTGYKDPTFASNWETLGNLSGSHKLHRGAYHFLSAPVGSSASQADNGTAQAKTLVDFLNLNGGLSDSDVRPMLDVEADLVAGATCNATNNVKDTTGVTCYHDRWADVSKADMIAKINAFTAYVTSHSCYPGQAARMCPRPVIYTNNRWFADKFGVTIAARFDSQLPKDAVWLARYYDKPWPTIIYPSTTRNQAGWQFSQSAVIATSASINPHYTSATDSDVFMGSPADFAVVMSTTVLPGD